MNAPTFPVQDATLSATALAESVLSQYDLPGRPGCTFFRKGICDTYRVMASTHGYYLKVYRHARRTRLDVSEEVRLLNHLHTQGVSVARPVAKRDGAYVSALNAPEGPRYAVLFEAAHGAAGDDGDPARIAALGVMVARLHGAADRMVGPYRRAHLDMRHLVDENLSVIAPLMADREPEFQVIVRIANACKERVVTLLPTTRPTYGICHGDLHGGDVRYDRSGTPTLFDFDSSGYGYRALDIGVFLASDDWMATTVEAEARRRHRLASFLDGYARIRPLTTSEQAAIELGPPIRHIFLMGFVLRYTATWDGNHWANDGFIDWHMAWFHHWAECNL